MEKFIWQGGEAAGDYDYFLLFYLSCNSIFRIDIQKIPLTCTFIYVYLFIYKNLVPQTGARRITLSTEVYHGSYTAPCNRVEYAISDKIS